MAGVSRETLDPARVDAAIAELRSGLTAEALAYVDYHAPRYRYLVSAVVSALRARFGEDLASARLLVVGPGFEVPLLHRLAGVRISSLGFGDSHGDGDARYFGYDLREAIAPETFPDVGRFDGVIAAEVIEHLPIPPELVLRPLGQALEPGALLWIQTPNAARLDVRVKVLRGRNPNERMRDALDNPGHHREYTADELVGMAPGLGLRVASVSRHNYFGGGGRHPRLHRAYARLEPLIPAGLREGVTIAYERDG